MADQYMQLGNDAVKNTAPQTLQFQNETVTATPSNNFQTPDTIVSRTPSSGVVTIPAEKLVPPKPITLPQPAQQDRASAFVSGLQTYQPTLESYIQSLTPRELTPAQQLQQGALGRIAELQGFAAGRSQAQLAAEQAQGLPDLQKQLSDLTGQFTVRNAEYTKNFLDQNTRQVSMGEIGTTQNAIKNAQAAELGLLQARAAALSGQINTAQAIASRAVDLQYGQVEDQIKVAQAQLAAIQPFLDREQQTLALARQQMLKDQENTLAEKKAEAKSIQELMLAAAQNGADASTLSQIQSSQSYGEASALAAPFLSQQQQFENQIKLQQLSLQQQQLDQGKYSVVKIGTDDMGNDIYAQFDQRTGEIKPLGGQSFPSPRVSQDGTTTVNPVIQSYAEEYAATGKMPAGVKPAMRAQITELAKDLPRQAGQLINATTGVTPTKVGAASVDGITAMYDILQKAEQLKQLDKQRYDGIVAGTLGKVFGSEDQQRYIDLRQEIVDLLARARTGAAMTASEEKFYADQLPGRFSTPFFRGVNTSSRIDNFVKKIDESLSSQLRVNGAAMYGYSKVKVGGKEYRVGDVIKNESGQQARVRADGTLQDLGGSERGGISINSTLKKAPAGTSQNLLATVATKFPENSVGGQCGDFVRKVVGALGQTYPRLGDSLKSKIAAVQKYGTDLANATIGSVIVTKENPTYGHVAYIIGQNEKGYIVAESNFKQSNKVSYGRVIPYNSSKVIGVINPNSKNT